MMLAIYGPTVTGKTDLAINLAKKFNGELISADSRQIYKGLDIGTGKVSFGSNTEKHKDYWVVDQVRIYGFDILNPGESFSAADFIRFASKTIKKIKASQKLPIVVGGTGFYLNALLDGIPSLGIPVNEELRNSLSKLSTEELFKKLSSLNPEKAKKNELFGP